MTTDLQLFDGRGAFVMPSEEKIAALDDATRKRWSTVRDAAADSTAADDALKAAQERVTNLMAEVRGAENFLREHFPPLTHTAAAQQFIATERMRRG